MPRLSLCARASVWAILSGILAIGAGVLIGRVSLSWPWRLVVSLIPVLPMLIYLALLLRIIRGLDELQLRIKLEGAMLALLGTALAAMAAGLLVRTGVLPRYDLADAWPWLWMLAFGLWVIGSGIARSRYR
ncbi:MAG TPA: hypothetical protein VNH46_11210 [Gemmatimonadales bacterium]|nr:hypothetical protein [Gemmatimonadales bacterium]